MKQTVEMKKAAFVILMQENGFEHTEATVLEGQPVYARTWNKVSPVVWHGDIASNFRITAYESCGIPIISIFENGRRTSTRDYSSPKRAMNAIKEIVRCAGYVM